MGRLQADAMSQETGWTIERQLEWHLRSNHYPPVPVEMVPVCRDVITHVNEGGDINAHFKLPGDATWRGEGSAPAWAIIEGHHLESWLIEEDEFFAEEGEE